MKMQINNLESNNSKVEERNRRWNRSVENYKLKYEISNDMLLTQTKYAKSQEEKFNNDLKLNTSQLKNEINQRLEVEERLSRCSYQLQHVTKTHLTEREALEQIINEMRNKERERERERCRQEVNIARERERERE
mmetsp:Transcript_9229/g.9297  ORF Transcript_9229/g.9297 Transcript_9229/m.9297 type:complete len:135 (+) Transcript_9229:695-1099(+)